jgi:hypothetical protein
VGGELAGERLGQAAEARAGLGLCGELAPGRA